MSYYTLGNVFISQVQLSVCYTSALGRLLLKRTTEQIYFFSIKHKDNCRHYVAHLEMKIIWVVQKFWPSINTMFLSYVDYGKYIYRNIFFHLKEQEHTKLWQLWCSYKKTCICVLIIFRFLACILHIFLWDLGIYEFHPNR